MDAQAPFAEDEDYLMLKDLRVDISQKEKSFSFCLWIYLLNSTSAPGVIIRQMHPTVEGEAPFLGLNEDKKIILFPLLYLHEEAPLPNSSALWNDMLCVQAKLECPLQKWIHVGCEVAQNFLCLHIDGVVVGEKALSCSSTSDPEGDNLPRISLIGNEGVEGEIHGYARYVRVLPFSSPVKDHFIKDPPLELSVDGSCFSDNHEVEEGIDGVWSVVGGKASCRRNFSLDVVLLDALGHVIDKEMELIASLFYADNDTPVEKSTDNPDAPLLISYDGVEHPSSDRPIKLLHGRASFKLKISQLSSKCDGRLFRVHFKPLKSQRYPFLEAYSSPIRCISRNRTIRPSVLWKKSTSAANQADEPQLSGPDGGSFKTQNSKGNSNVQLLTQNEWRHGSTPKRVKMGYEKSSVRIYANTISQRPGDRCGPHAMTCNEDEKFENIEVTDNTPSDSESVHVKNSASKRVTNTRNPVPDMILFKYCLEGMQERATLLRDVIVSASDLDMVDFAQQVSLYTGCSHHRQQILIAKGLIQEGAETWNSIPRNTHMALWKNAAREIERRFLKISCGASRSLTEQDMELLHRMAGSNDSISRENFDRMWHWLYPIASALSMDQIKTIWECTSPKWIEGLITKDEAEASLIGPSRHLQTPGTFVLRFPTSRSWPHPDAGSLIVTYVGADHTIHHRLISLGNSGKGDMNQKPLQELLFAEPELSQLGRVTRRTSQFVGEESEDIFQLRKR